MKQPPYILVVNGTKVDRPVFVLGAPHSGVGLVARALRRAPGFHVSAGHPSVLKAVYAFARRPSIAHANGSGSATLLRDALAESWQLTPRTCPRCPGGPVPARLAAEPCEHAARTTRYGDAGPDLLYSTAALARAFDDAAFVQIIRDGRDAVADMLDDEQSLTWFKPGLANLEEEFPNPFFGVETEEEREDYPRLSLAAKCALRWRSAVRLSAKLRGELPGDRLLTLRYEEVPGKEVETAERLSDFTGARVSSVELVRADHDGTGSWRTRLDPGQRAEVQSVARPELSRLGYL
ncbi:sulfotransferase [Actinorugispora endophytica]|uniref:Sulfotransferase family protein n=1 Tax=Actinorugispora endophytica TaxID=1605990 RepID=A0A4R6V0M9_9ACTN|nr:sulfotransferase [Actinorugispora endophytica]TDQ53303.1 sulfotransferase family protein [Actinorugispora endophytica]